MSTSVLGLFLLSLSAAAASPEAFLIQTPVVKEGWDWTLPADVTVTLVRVVKGIF